jgi:HK97 gp10 family phage protein
MNPMTIDDFVAKLDKMQAQYPADAEEALTKGARRMTKHLRKETPRGKVKEHKHKLGKSWKCTIRGFHSSDVRAEIRNTSPHFHLVNRGVQNPKDYHGNPRPDWKASMNKHVGFMEKTIKNNWSDVKSLMAKDFYKRVRDNLG